MPSTQLIIAMGAIMPIVDSFLVGLRLYAKHGKTRYGLDDYLILLALVSTDSCRLYHISYALADLLCS